MRKTNQLKPLPVRIPAWLNRIEDLAKEGNLKPDRVRAVIQQFFIAWVKDKRIEKTKDFKDDNRIPDYFAVNAELLKEIAGKHYKTYVKFLEDKHVVSRLRNSRGGSCYAVGVHSTLFKWCKPEDMVGKIPFRLERIHDYRIIKAILRTRDNHIKDTVRIKSHTAEEFRDVFEQLREFSKHVVFVPTTEQSLISDEDELFTQEVIRGTITWDTVCSFGNRYHNQFTTLPKESRKLIRYKGREETELLMLDFANSQPYFSSVIGCGKLIELLLPEFLPVVLPILKRIEQKEDYLLYRKLCAEGLLYEYFKELQGMERDEVKGKLFDAVLFAKKRVKGEKKLFQNTFKKIFPSVLLMVKEIKRMTENDLPLLKEVIKPPGVKFKFPGSNNSYKLVAAMMQRLESRIVFRHIVPELIKAGIKPLLTVHDSFLILPEFEETARQIITRAFEQFGVHPPKIKSEFL